MASTNGIEFQMDALLPAEMAARAQEIGARKAAQGVMTVFVLAVLAGAFIALGALFSTTVSAGASGVLPFGITRLVSGFVFSLGLILVVVGGAELFTGNNLIVMAWASRHISTAQLLRNWGIVYLGNFVGSIATTLIVFLSRQYTFGGGAIGLAALNTAQAKVGLDFVQAVALGMLCNALVCLAVWLCYSARSTVDRIVSIVFPITAFVAAGFEHSIANMYFIPIGLLIRDFGTPAFWAAIEKTPADYASLTWGSFVVNNLVPVTLGNIIGGALMVGVVYWFVYLHNHRSQP